MVRKKSTHKTLGILIILFFTVLAVSVAEIQGVRAATYIITASADTHSTINPSGNYPVSNNTDLNVTFTPNQGYIISSVVVDNSTAPLTSPYTFKNITTNHNITVKTSIINFTITTSTDTHSTINPSGAVKVSFGAAQNFTYSANPGYSITSVLVNGTSTSIAGTILQ